MNSPVILRDPIEMQVEFDTPTVLPSVDRGKRVPREEVVIGVTRVEANQIFRDRINSRQTPVPTPQEKSLVPPPVVRSPVVKLPAVYKMSKSARKALTSNVRFAPAAKSIRVKTNNKPKFTSGSQGIRVVHKELVGSLISSSTTLNYATTAFTINPGRSGLFPWLSTFAGNFDKYRIHKLIVHLISNQPTSTAGRIGVGIDYDSTDVAPADRVEFFNLTHHEECAPWDSVSFQPPLKPDIKFINSHTTTDSKLIDYGSIFVMADQIVATSTSLADIIIEYDVELLEPQQALLSTMLFYDSTMAAFSEYTILGPSIGTFVTTSSTTVWEISVPQGAYMLTGSVYDSGAGSPVVTPAVNGGTGAYSACSSTTQTVLQCLFKTTTNTGKIRITFSGVTIANLEEQSWQLTRIAPAAYNINTLRTTLTTY